MKVCTKCNENKPLTEYYKNKNYKDGHQYYCKLCMNSETSTTKRDVSKYRYKAREDRIAHAEKLKLERGCESGSCGWSGEFTPEMLHWDHLDRSTKTIHVSKAVRSNMAWEKVETEMDKCQVLCANCHSYKTRSNKEYN